MTVRRTMTEQGATVPSAAVVQKKLDSLVDRHRVPGAQLVLDLHGKRISACSGKESMGTGTEVTPRSTFPLGSVSKICTATVAMQLVVSGDVELDSSIGGYVPGGMRGDTCVDGVTLRQLLSHTSGLPLSFDVADPAALSLGQCMQACAVVDRVDRPGARFSYSNVGYALVGLVIESLTGMYWYEAVEMLLMRRLGSQIVMNTESGGRSGAEFLRPTVRGHAMQGRSGRLVEIEQRCPVYLGPAGGLGGSATDIAALGLLLAGASDQAVPLITPELLRAIREPQPRTTALGMADQWTPGLAVFRGKSAVWFGHDGSIGGASAHLRFEPSVRTVIALTTNAAWGASLWADVVDALADMGVHVGDLEQPRLVACPADELPDCSGTFANADVTYRVAYDGSDIILHAGRGGVPLTVDSDLNFCGGGEAYQPRYVGRFVRETHHEPIDLMEINGHVARRRDPGNSEARSRGSHVT